MDQLADFDSFRFGIRAEIDRSTALPENSAERSGPPFGGPFPIATSAISTRKSIPTGQRSATPVGSAALSCGRYPIDAVEAFEKENFCTIVQHRSEAA